MSQILATRRAAKPYQCDCEFPLPDAYLYGHDEIKRGDVYLRIALTPDDPDIGNSGWRTARYCRPCGESIYNWIAPIGEREGES